MSKFRRGVKSFPLATGTGNSALLDADPFIFYALEFFSSVIETHAGARLLEAASGTPSVTDAVAMTVPFDPVPVLGSTQFKFPLLAVYRRTGEFDYRTIAWREDNSKFEVTYVLPPLDAADAEQLAPMLIAIRDVLDDRASLGSDEAYTPTNGTLGQTFWVDLAGVAKILFTEYEVGVIHGAPDDLTFYTLRMRGTVTERADYADGSLEDWNGADADVNVAESLQQTTLDGVSQFATYPAPTLTLATPATGTKAGGTSVTLTGTGFLVGTTPLVQFGGQVATAVHVASATSVTCVTPPHDTFTSFTPTTDPATVALTGWWRDLAALPVSGTASAGGSGSQSLITDGANPTFGHTLNRHGYATFNGSSQHVLSAATVDTFFNASAWSAWALINVASIAGDQSFLLDDPDQWFGLVVFPNIVQTDEYFVSANQWDSTFSGGSYRTAQTLVSYKYGTWVLAQMKFDGAHLSVRVNGGPWTTVACPHNLENLTNQLRVGFDSSSSIAEVGTANTALSDASFDAIRYYVSDRYQVDLFDVADVVLTDAEGLSATLTAGYTFT